MINRDFKQSFQRVGTLVLLVIATLLIQCHCGLRDGNTKQAKQPNKSDKPNKPDKPDNNQPPDDNQPEPVITDDIIGKGGNRLYHNSEFSELLKKLNNLRDQVPGEDIDEVIDAQGATALHKAVDLLNKDIIKALLDSGADVNKSNKDGLTPLHQAAMNGSLEAMQALLGSDKINLNAKDNYQKTALHYTILHTDDQAASLVESLLKKEVDVNARDQDGETVLYKACAKNKLETVRALLKHKDIQVNLPDKNGIIPLQVLKPGVNYLQIKQLLEDAAVRQP
jgi:ankyrin repeat protein